MPDEQRTGLPYDPIEEARRQWGAHGWEDGSSGMAAITSVMRAQQIYMARVEAVLRPLGITFARYETMMLLYFSRRGA
ncbi:MAG: MarR family transcriptional regulator, partial [Actinomycetota bacterium]|nr:MarR family transcriptional regulator [Actinomycetota bacterium]